MVLDDDGEKEEENHENPEDSRPDKDSKLELPRYAVLPHGHIACYHMGTSRIL
jgi:hypothetical protein